MGELIATIKELFIKDINDYIYIYGSVIGAVIAAFFAWKTHSLTKRINKRKLPVKLFEMIFERALTEYFFKMSEVLIQIDSFDFQEFSSALEDFKTCIFQFKFYDESFYRELLKLTSDLEDNIVLINGTSLSSKRIKIKAKVEKNLRDIYDRLLGYYYKIDK